ncbi:ATP-binding cassette domain-containing protein [Candidatus Dependentiae bacterium]|nr:ATP-binding cassette domain-containing protein [Candidatus Dependentiae bacterium]
MENAVEIKNLVKEFDIYHETASLIGLIFSGGKKTRFSALKGINMNIEKGKTIGITGPNGSGKTTLLKILSGTLYPTSGIVDIQGKVSSILELGAGFHPELTGRENIYLNALLLGFKKDEIEKKYDSIVKFADIGGFIDTKVKTFSSGMYLRLGFSIAIHADFDILLIDEILAVGDVGFQAKCLQRLRDFQEEGKTIIIVSHNLGLLTRLSNKVYNMAEGKLSPIALKEDKSEEKIEEKEEKIEEVKPTFKEEFHFEVFTKMDMLYRMIEFLGLSNPKLLYLSLDSYSPEFFLKKYEHFIMNPGMKTMDLKFTPEALPFLNYFDISIGFNIIPFLEIEKTKSFLMQFFETPKTLGILSYLTPSKKRVEAELFSYKFCEENYSIQDKIIKSKSELEFNDDSNIINFLKKNNINYREFYILSIYEWLLYSIIINVTYDIFERSILFRKLNSVINKAGYSTSLSSKGMYQKVIIFSHNEIPFKIEENNLNQETIFEKLFLSISGIKQEELITNIEKRKLTKLNSLENKIKTLLKNKFEIHI